MEEEVMKRKGSEGNKEIRVKLKLKGKKSRKRLSWKKCKNRANCYLVLITLLLLWSFQGVKALFDFVFLLEYEIVVLIYGYFNSHQIMILVKTDKTKNCTFQKLHKYLPF